MTFPWWRMFLEGLHWAWYPWWKPFLWCSIGAFLGFTGMAW